MKRILALVICVTILGALVGCGPKVEGKWSAKLGMADTTWEFKSDKVFNLTVAGMTMAGTWELKGDKIKMTIKGKPEEMTMKMEKDTMTLTPSNSSMALVLTRIKE